MNDGSYKPGRARSGSKKFVHPYCSEHDNRRKRKLIKLSLLICLHILHLNVQYHPHCYVASLSTLLVNEYIGNSIYVNVYLSMKISFSQIENGNGSSLCAAANLNKRKKSQQPQRIRLL